MKNFNHQPQPQPRLMNFGELREHFKEERPLTANGEWQPPYDPVFEATYKMNPAEQRKFIKDLQLQVYNQQTQQLERGNGRFTSDGVDRRTPSVPRGTSRMQSNSYQVVKNNGSKYVRMQYGQKKSLVERAKQQGRQEFIEEVKFKTKVAAIGLVALLGVGAAAYRPAVEAYTNATHAVETAYENNVVKPIDNMKRATTETMDKISENPVVKFTGGLVTKLTEGEELKRPIPDDEYESIMNASQEKAEPTVTPEAEEVSIKTDSENRNPAASAIKEVISDKEAKIAEAVNPDPEIPPFKYQDAINKAVEETGTSHKEFHLLRLSENGGENLMAVNHNSNGTIDVSLFQDNVKPTDTEEIQRLQSDPYYAAWKAGMKMKNRREWLKDENLALASYNLGPSGAVSDPKAALNRIQHIYEKAGMEVPETEFTRNPYEYLEKHWDDFKSAGLSIPDKPPAVPKTAMK